MLKKRNVKCLPNFDSDLLKRNPDIADIILRGVKKEERKGESGIVEKRDEENNFWKPEENKDWDHEILDLLRNVSDLSNDDQIVSLVNMLKGPPERIKMKNNLYKHIEACLKKKIPDCTVILYGSSSNGFAFQDSDLDVFVDFQLVGSSSVCGSPGEEENNSRDKARTNLVAHKLRTEERFKSARAILNARIPIVKMRDSKTGIDCDFNVVSSMGVVNSMLINYYRTLDTRCGYLISAVKYMASKLGVVGHGSGDHLNSYTIVIMAIFFLQVRGILPSVATLQKNVKAENKRGWNVAFDKDFKISEWRAEAETSESYQGELTLFSMLKEFLVFYICFPYDTHIICPLLGSPVKKYNLKLGYNLPKALEQAPHFGKKKVKLEVDKSLLVIQDPFELTRNISGRISDAHLSFMISMFEQSYKKSRKRPFVELFDKSEVDSTDYTIETEIWSLQNKINLFSSDGETIQDSDETLSSLDDNIVNFE